MLHAFYMHFVHCGCALGLQFSIILHDFPHAICHLEFAHVFEGFGMLFGRLWHAKIDANSMKNRKENKKKSSTF